MLWVQLRAPYGMIESGPDAYDAFNCRSLFAKEPLVIGLFCGDWPIKIRHMMGEGGQDAHDTFNCTSLFAKGPLVIGLFCEKWPRKIRYATHLGHSLGPLYSVWPSPIAFLIFLGQFPQKSPIISGSFADNDLQLQDSYGSWALCGLLWVIAALSLSVC